MSADWQKWIPRLFIGGFAVVALLINSLFYREEGVRTTASPPALTAAVDAIRETRLQQERIEMQAKEAARKAAEDVAAERARYLARYLNTGFARKPGTTMLALVVASENGKLNQVVSAALSDKFKAQNVETSSLFFKPEFVSDGLFTEAFTGSTEVLKRLELSTTWDTLLLAHQTVQYSSNPALENVITASMRLEVVTLPLAGQGESRAWTFLASGAGFKQNDARALAEERLIKQIADDQKLSSQPITLNQKK